jgi:hypothetical protein
MATCKWCNESGTFLKVSDIGLCMNCDQVIADNVHFSSNKIKQALDNLEYYDSVEDAIENFIEILKYAKPLAIYENKGIKTLEHLPSVLINTYTDKLNWMKDLKKYGFEVYRSFYCNAADTSQQNEDGSSRQEIIGHCKAGDKLFPITAPFGKVKAAIKLVTKDNKQIGWLTQKVAAEFYNLINDNDFEFDIEISEITVVTDWNSDKSKKGCFMRFTCFQR